ncbi:MAG: exodeoxyribonuclease I, partial [Wenzhouxiangella sp.]
GRQRLPVKLVRTNRCPMLAPMSVLDRSAARRLAIDSTVVAEHARLLRAAPEFVHRLQTLFDQPTTPIADPELALYAGFVPRADLILRDRIRSMTPEQLATLKTPFQDERLNELLFRYRARLWPESLDDEDHQRWEQYRQRRLMDDPDLAGLRIAEYRERLRILLQGSPVRRDVLEALLRWPEEIGLSGSRDILSST